MALRIDAPADAAAQFVLPDLRDHKVYKGLRVRKVPLVQEALRERRVRWVRQVLKALPERQAPLVHRVP